MDATNVIQSAGRGRWAVAAMFLINGFMLGPTIAAMFIAVWHIHVSSRPLGTRGE